MRIVGGRLRGRNLVAPKSAAIRPTADRLRESLFNVLGALGLQVTRLIRISFGPFRLGELAEGAVEEVGTRVLREQIGERIAQEAGADFAAPVLQRGADAPKADKTPDRPAQVRRGLLTDRKGRHVPVARIGAAQEERPPKHRTRRHHGRSARKRDRP